MEQEIYTSDNGNKLYIMRGLPGSGKSTLARALANTVYSTDDFFMKDGIYQFDPKKIGEAHQWNQKRSKEALDSSVPQVVVDNTNTCAWEIRPYVEYGLENDYSISLVESDAPHKWDVQRLSELNSHGVPLEVIERMKERYEHNLTLDQILKAESPFQ